jgi:ubiquinone/menaquinone biosynthesis C-methylase UbiE
VHLGPRVQAWLYNRWSRKYDEGKRASQLQDDEMLAQPLVQALTGVPEPFLLDFATGTGRLSLVLLNRPEFTGKIVALDLSQGMLEQAAAKLATSNGPHPMDSYPPSARRVELLRHRFLPLPFPDASFDVVCALEVLELFPVMDEPLRELARILRPGGIFLTSRGTEESRRKARIKSAETFIPLLESHGFEQVNITRWWTLFDRVLARRQGVFVPAERRSLGDVLLCSSCGQIDWEQSIKSWRCQNCGKELSVTQDGIVLN